MDERRTAVVTGAAQGIGLAIAERLARDKFSRLVLVDCDDASLAGASARLRRDGVEVETCVVDLADISATWACLKPLIQHGGKLNALVNAAGLTDRGGLFDTDEATFNRLFAVNTRAPFFLMQALVPLMATESGGVVINVTSMLAYGGPPFLLAYSASKAALVSLTKGAANALKRERVRVFGINLGWTVTPGEHRVQTQRHGLPETWADDIGRKQPFGRLIEPRDVADLVAFLVSPSSSMMTGAIIDFDQYVAGTVDDNPGAIN